MFTKTPASILKTCALVPLVLLAVALLAGCGKPVASTPKAADTSSDSDTVAAATNTPEADTGPGPGEKVCFACQGTGTVKCMAPGCADGMVDCPGPCLKLTRGTWIHMDVPGHPPTDLWQKFYQADGSYMAYNQNHVGHVIVMQNGMAVDSGPCKICGGTGKVPCSVCKGTGKVVCPICEGKKYVPIAWTPMDNPWLDNQPDLIRLTSGKIMFGKVIYTNDSDLTIKTRNGQFAHIPVSEIVPKSDLVSTNAAL